jgi:hypothetical protein
MVTGLSSARCKPARQLRNLATMNDNNFAKSLEKMTLSIAAGIVDRSGAGPAAAGELTDRTVDRSAGRRRGSSGTLARLLAVLAVSLLMSACTAVKLGYENLPLVAEWQADRFLSLDGEQEALVTRHAKSLQRWHRRNLLPVYADFLRRVEEELRHPVTAGQVAAWRQTAVRTWAPLAEEAAPAVADLAVTLRPEQLAHLRKALAKANEKSAAEYRPADPVKRREARYDRLVERTESLMGSASDEQKQLIRTSAAAMAVNEDSWWQARLARQKTIVDLLTNLATEKPDPAEATRRARVALLSLFSYHDASFESIAATTLAPPESASQRSLRADVEAASVAGDELTAGVIALATPAQRRQMFKRLDGYREDFSLLAAR